MEQLPGENVDSCGLISHYLKKQFGSVRGSSLAISHMDILDNLDFIKVYEKYEEMSYHTFYKGDIFNFRPIYKAFEGWKKSTKAIKKLEEFPKKC
jgi:adenylosuccinate synthase